MSVQLRQRRQIDAAFDRVTNPTEEDTWNADNTLAYQYAYGADGNRRWAQDIANNAWTWYPCGVACGAGELVEQGSDLTGSTWTTNAQYLRVGGGCSSMLIRRKSSTDDEYHHEDPLGNFGVITGANGAVLSSNVYDAFMAQQYGQGVCLSLSITAGIRRLNDRNATIIYNSVDKAYCEPKRALQLNSYHAANAVGGPSFWYGQCVQRCNKVYNAWINWLNGFETQTLNACDALGDIPYISHTAVARCKNQVYVRFNLWKAILEQRKAECMTNCINCFANGGHGHIPGTAPCHKKHKRTYPPVRHNPYL